MVFYMFNLPKGVAVTIFFLIVWLVLVVISIKMSLVIVPKGAVYTVQRTDGHVYQISEGIHWIMFVSERVIEKNLSK